METQAFMYMWDKNWLWRCPYPKLPSNIHLAIGLLQVAVAISTRFMQLLSYSDTFNGYYITTNN